MRNVIVSSNIQGNFIEKKKYSDRNIYFRGNRDYVVREESTLGVASRILMANFLPSIFLLRQYDGMITSNVLLFIDSRIFE